MCGMALNNQIENPVLSATVSVPSRRIVRQNTARGAGWRNLEGFCRNVMQHAQAS